MALLLFVLGGFLAVFAIPVFLYLYFKSKMKKMGFSNMNFNEIKNLAKTLEDTPKSVGGITNLLLPEIRRDFPELNEQVLFQKAESNIRSILNSIEAEIVNDSSIVMIKSNLEGIIEDNKSRKLKISYDNIVIHAQAIKDYRKKDGMATISIVNSVEYTIVENEETNKIFDRCLTIYGYIYDEEKVGHNNSIIGLHCPNCGAPLKNLGLLSCEYCQGSLREYNLKAWKIINYKSDYQKKGR